MCVLSVSLSVKEIYQLKTSFLVRPFLDSGKTGCLCPDKNFSLKVVKSEGLYSGNITCLI